MQLDFCRRQILGSVNGFLTQMKIKDECVFSALEESKLPHVEMRVMTKWRDFMKKLALAAAVLALLSATANAQVGKGKAPPPPPVVTKG